MSSYIGNTLEISDEDVFFSTASDTSIVSTVVFDWWNALPDWRKNAYRIPVFTALIYQQYREFARILMIKNLNELRKFVLKIS